MWDPLSILIRSTVPLLLRNKRAKCLLVSFLLAGLVPLFAAEGCRPKPSSKSTYVLPQTPPFLDDKLALEKALETLQNFHPSDSWQPMFYSDTKAPDNTQDRYLQRNRFNANRGTVHFIDRQAGIDKVVGLELSGTQLICEILASK